MGSRKSGRSILSWDACEEVARATAVELVRDPRVWNVNHGRARLRLSNAWIRGAMLSRLDGTVRPVIRGIRRGVSGGWRPEEHTKLLESARLAPMSVVEVRIFSCFLLFVLLRVCLNGVADRSNVFVCFSLFAAVVALLRCNG